MKQEIAKLWTKALRSGKYKQAKRRLKTKSGYCCLGVLCDVSAFKGWHGIILLPEEVQEWSGMMSSIGEYGEFKEANSLTDDNDEGKSFDEIADIIDLHWEFL